MQTRSQHGVMRMGMRLPFARIGELTPTGAGIDFIAVALTNA